MEYEKEQIYIIPKNFEEKGGIFGGKIKIRNLAEAGIVFFTLFYIGGTLLYFLDFTIKLVLFSIIVAPLTAITFIGIFGDSLSEFLLNLYAFRKKQRTLSFKLPNEDDLWLTPPTEEKSKLDSLKNKMKKRK